MHKMIYSGISWIGEIPETWCVRKLNSIASVITDYVASGSFADLAANVQYLDYPDYAMLVRTADLSGTRDNTVYINEHAYNFLSNSNLFGGEVILSNIGSVGNVFYFEPKYERNSLAPNAIMINGCECNRYIYYWFLNPVANDELKRIGSHAVQLKFNKTQLRQFPIVCPPADEQRKIAAALDTECAKIDTLIANVQAQIDKLKSYKQSMIVDAVTKGLDRSVPMKESGVDWVKRIPAGWEMLYPKALFTQRKDRAKPTDRQLTASQQFGIMDQEEYMAMTGTRVVVVEKDFDILKHVEAGDFVISMRSFQGGLEYSEISGCISSAYVMLKPSSDRVYSRYYRWLLKSSLYINAIRSTSNLVRDGQAMRYANFIQIWLPCPPMDEQKTIADYLDEKCPQIDRLITIKQAKIEKLEQYKKSLIYEYVTGKKEVS